MLAADFISKIRIAIIAFLIFVLYAVLGIRLWQIQVLKGEDTRDVVTRQYLRKIRIPAIRGRILTSDGVPLADNRPSMDVVFHVSEMRQPGSLGKTIDFITEKVQFVARAIGRTDFPTRNDISYHTSRTPGLPLTVFQDLTKEETAKAYEISASVPGMELVCDAIRVYPHGTLAGHLIGYVRKDDPGRADDRKSYSYYVPDVVGKSGLELACDNFPDSPQSPQSGDDPAVPVQKRPLLKGTPGKKIVVVDHRRFVRDSGGPEIPAENGKSLILTMNFKAQKIAEDLIEGLSAAVIVMNSHTGEIIAMASAPSYAPSDFVPFITHQDYKQLMEAPDRPLFNKALQGSYSPGSIIKPLMGLSFLHFKEDGSDPMICDGYTPIGDYKLNCWIRPQTGGGHGELDLHEAITVSCNDFFVTKGIELGIDNISQTYASAGFGRKTGFLLPETSGRLPSRTRKKNWNTFDTALVSIGQGELLISPLQAAVYMSAIANGGTIYRPLIIKNIVDCNDNIVYIAKPEERGKLLTTPEHLALIHSAMHNAVYAANGGAKRAKNKSMELRGKTGTAEVGSGAKRYKNTWFAGFGTSPDTGKTYTIVVFVEHGISGGYTAAPIAAKFFEQWTPE
ncbi:MAG: hypothetical protein IJW05_00120 [Lentisphaeria bacterium]|nr:hypothetical protein [Lentisphaeria bacterium]